MTSSIARELMISHRKFTLLLFTLFRYSLMMLQQHSQSNETGIKHLGMDDDF